MFHGNLFPERQRPNNMEQKGHNDKRILDRDSDPQTVHSRNNSFQSLAICSLWNLELGLPQTGR